MRWISFRRRCSIILILAALYLSAGVGSSASRNFGTPPWLQAVIAGTVLLVAFVSASAGLRLERRAQEIETTNRANEHIRKYNELLREKRSHLSRLGDDKEYTTRPLTELLILAFHVFVVLSCMFVWCLVWLSWLQGTGQLILYVGIAVILLIFGLISRARFAKLLDRFLK